MVYRLSRAFCKIRERYAWKCLYRELNSDSGFTVSLCHRPRRSGTAADCQYIKYYMSRTYCSTKLRIAREKADQNEGTEGYRPQGGVFPVRTE